MSGFGESSRSGLKLRISGRERLLNAAKLPFEKIGRMTALSPTRSLVEEERESADRTSQVASQIQQITQARCMICVVRGTGLLSAVEKKEGHDRTRILICFSSLAHFEDVIG